MYKNPIFCFDFDNYLILNEENAQTSQLILESEYLRLRRTAYFYAFFAHDLVNNQFVLVGSENKKRHPNFYKEGGSCDQIFPNFAKFS